ncbi:MAG TPA: cbb3-type cytochrome c oxidase subunit I [Candidatus Paceibacterota bacterium]|jgi:cytochrome c oxidase cbb3-type subunit 1|nr:cbb3-type cytochrome c oxidase subunit I [Candidatus Paceibacterota bacterium]
MVSPEAKAKAAAGAPAIDAGSAEETVSCRWPLLVLFLGAAGWLVAGSLLGLLASIKFHSPMFLAEPAWLTYGRVKAASAALLVYGFCVPTALGVGLWLMSRLGRVALAGPVVAGFGGGLLHAGVAVGLVGVLRGDGTGFLHLEFPAGAAGLVFLGYLLLGTVGVLTLYRRREARMEAAQWFVLAGLFWFGWIYSTANLCLLVFPVRGVAQAAINYWHTGNLLGVWMGLMGLGTVFALLPRLAGREPGREYVAMFVFWVLLLFGSWTGIPATAPLPAWMPALSTVGTVLSGLGVLGVAVIVHQTLAGRYGSVWRDERLRFLGLGVAAYVVGGVMQVVEALSGRSWMLHFTWFTAAREWMQVYGYLALVMFGTVYAIVPALVGVDWWSRRFLRLHFWLAGAGLLFVAAPLAAGGVVEAARLLNPALGFVEVSRGTLMFLRLSTIGELLILAGNGLFFVNLAGTVAGICRRALADALRRWGAETTGEGAAA